MKRILLLFLFTLNCVLGFAQNNPYRPANRPNKFYYDKADKEFKEASTAQHISYNPFTGFLEYNLYSIQWDYVDLSSNCCVMKSAKGSRYFVGRVKRHFQRQNGKRTEVVVLSGKGVLKKISNDKAEYTSGTWRNNLLKGDVLIKDTLDHYHFCVFKNGKKIDGSERAATEDEISDMKHEIESFENKIWAAGFISVLEETQE